MSTFALLGIPAAGGAGVFHIVFMYLVYSLMYFWAIAYSIILSASPYSDLVEYWQA